MIQPDASALAAGRLGRPVEGPQQEQRDARLTGHREEMVLNAAYLAEQPVFAAFCTVLEV
jgi:hypothetical protein